MKRLLYGLLLVTITASVSVAQISIGHIGTASPIQTGYVVVTPVNGNGQGISVSETFGQRVGGTLYQSSVFSSPLVTLTDVFISVDPNTAMDTGIAIVNPNSSAVTVNMSLANQQGTAIAQRNITLAGLQQTSHFATELFAGTPEFNSAFNGLMFVRSNIPVAVMGLTFIGPSFTSLPVAAQLTPPNTGTTTVTTATGQTTVVVAGTTAGTVTATVSPNTTTIVGNGGALLPQFATGGGWASQIVIANTSSVQQIVRVDIFNSNGMQLLVPFSSQLSSVLVPPGGVVTFSTAS